MPGRTICLLAWLSAAALAFVACPMAVEELDESPTATPELVRPQPGATVDLTPAAAVPEVTCPDPYPGGAPPPPEGQEREPGAPIRLTPPAAVSPPEPYQPLPFTVDAALDARLRDALAEEIDTFAVVVKNLADGSGVAINADRTFYAASLFKVWVMVEVFHQRSLGLLSLDEQYVVSDYYESFGLGPRLTAHCETLSLARALEAMMAVSDNAAAVLLQDRVGSANVNAALAALGLTGSALTEEGDLPTTAADMALLLEAIARPDRAIDEAASQEMVDLLATESLADRLPAGLPEGTLAAHKTANWENATHDAGVVYSPAAAYIIALLSDRGYDDYPGETMADVSRVVYEYYNPG